MHQNARINVTPYIDILLVLLIIFMTLQPQLRHDLRTRATEEAADGAAARAPLLLRIDSDFKIRLAGVEVRLSELAETLDERLSRRSEKAVFIQAPAEIDFGSIIRLVDIAKGAGAGEIGLIGES